MCIEDVRLGRASLFSETDVAVGLASVQVIPAAPSRFSLLLGPPLVGTVTYSTVNPAVSGVGLNLSAGQPPIRLNIKDDGLSVTMAWFAICSSAAQTVFVGSALLPIT